MSGRSFGGAYSPGRGADGAKPYDGKDGPRYGAPGGPPAHARPGGFWAKSLYAAPFPLVFSIYGEILRGAPLQAAGEILCGLGLLLGAELLREGRKAETAYMERASAARPAVPRKILAALVCALSCGALAAWAWGLGLIAGAGYGLLAGGLHLVAFGIDPLKNKGFASDARRAETALAAAEEMIAETLAASKRLGDDALELRVRALMQEARPVLREIERDPRELPRARRFLSVTLTGTRDATVKYARLGLTDPELRAAYAGLLTQLEDSFARTRDRLVAEDRTDLEVEIEVLTERLRRDGAGAPF